MVSYKVFKFLHILGIAGLGLASILLVWMHVMIGLFGYFYAYEHVKFVAWFEMVMVFYVFGYYCWLICNHWRHNPPWQTKEEEESE